MYIKSIELADYRNYESLSMEFDSGTNILFGDNAQGKTNILEAIYVAATTKSHKGSKDSDIVNFNKEEAHIRTYLLKENVETRVDMHLRKNKSKGIAIVWVAISLAFAVVIGVLGRAYLYPTVLGADGGTTEVVFIEMIKQVFTIDIRLPIVAGLFLCGILAAIMSTADSQLLVTASSVSEDIYKGIVNQKASQDNVMKVSKITVVAVAVLAYIIAWDPNSSIMGLVSNAWAGLGAAFGPTVLMSLFWKRCNLQGAVAGILSGGLTVIIWDYIPLVGGATLGTVTGLYSLAIGFLISIVLIVIVSLCTKAPDASIVAEFDRVASDEEI